GLFDGLAWPTREKGSVLLVPLFLLASGAVRPTAGRVATPGNASQRHLLAAAGAVVSGLAVIGCPWTVRNAAGIGAFVPVSTGTGSAIAFYLLVVLFGLALLTPAARSAPPWLWVTAGLMLLPVFLVATSLRFRPPFDVFLIVVSATVSALVTPRRRAPLAPAT